MGPRSDAAKALGGTRYFLSDLISRGGPWFEVARGGLQIFLESKDYRYKQEGARKWNSEEEVFEMQPIIC
jgi:hypothetical protein